MSVDTDDKSTEDDSKVIKKIRAKLKAAEARAETAADDARKEIVREATAISLLGKKYEGLAKYFSLEVDGELTEAEAKKWLDGRGLAGSTDSDKTNSDDADSDKDSATDLESVTNLSSKVAATATVTPDQKVDAEIGKAADDFANIGDLPALAAKLAGLMPE